VPNPVGLNLPSSLSTYCRSRIVLIIGA